MSEQEPPKTPPQENYVYGERLQMTSQNHSRDGRCPNGGCTDYQTGKPVLDAKRLVGIGKLPESLVKKGWLDDEQQEYAAILKCPCCFEKYWYHLYEDGALDFNELLRNRQG